MSEIDKWRSWARGVIAQRGRQSIDTSTWKDEELRAGVFRVSSAPEWLIREDRYLQRLWEIWTSTARDFDEHAAKTLCRTVAAVKTRRQKLGLVKEQK